MLEKINMSNTQWNTTAFFRRHCSVKMYEGRGRDGCEGEIRGKIAVVVDTQKYH